MTRFLSFAGILTYHGFKIWRFGLWLHLLEIGPARSAPPLRGGRRIASPKGKDRRPPAHLLGPSGAEFFVFNDFCDLCNIDMRNCAANSVFPSDPFPKTDDGCTFSENK